MSTESCIFCKIANGEIPSASIYEDDEFKVILDLSPATKGHALILPKTHYRNIFDMDADMAAKTFALASTLAKGMKEALGCDGMNIVQNNEEIAGQSVFHFHMHLIPRYKGDGQRILWTPNESTSESLAKTAEQIKSFL